MKKTLWTLALLLACAGTGYADTLSGQVREIDTAGNSLTLVAQRADSTEPAEYKVVWDDEFAEAARLESARAGDTLVLNAEQNPVTRNWKAIGVGGALAAAENNLLRTEDQTISGKILNIDTAGRRLVLSSENVDAAGEPIQYAVVWDEASGDIREQLQKASVGDKLTLRADQNVVTKNWKAKSIAGPIEAMTKGGVHMLSGQVKSVDASKNFIVLNTTDASGAAVEQKLVWDEDFTQQAKLESAKVGEMLKVHADQNMITRNWKVKAIA